MENFAYCLIMLVIIWLLILIAKNTEHVDEQALEKLIRDVHEKERDLKRMNHLISEIGRISKEKTKAIKVHDWDLLNTLDEEQKRNNIIFNSLVNKNYE